MLLGLDDSWEEVLRFSISDTGTQSDLTCIVNLDLNVCQVLDLKSALVLTLPFHILLAIRSIEYPGPFSLELVMDKICSLQHCT